MSRHTLYVFLLATVLCMACTTDGDTELTDNTPQKVLFEEPVVAVATRGNNAVPNGGKYPTTWNFTVSAVKHTGDFTTWSAGTAYMENVDCGYNTSAMSWDPEKGSGGVPYYWPDDGSKLTLQAYSPTSWGATIGSNGITKASQALATDGSQADLLFSNRTPNQERITATSQYDIGSCYAVQMQFRHALASIVFKAKKKESYDGVTFTLDNITLRGIYAAGSFAQNMPDNGTTSTDDAPTWTIDPSAVLTDYDNVIVTPYVVTAHGAAEPALINGNSRDLLVMPQQLNASARFEISYTFQPDGGMAVTQSHTVYLRDLLYNGVAGSAAAFPGLEMGKQYAYTIVLERARILFEPVVTHTWSDIIINDVIVD